MLCWHGRCQLDGPWGVTDREPTQKGFSSGRFPKTFFQMRYNVSTEGLKAFAAEVMGVAETLRLFVELVLAPSHMLQDESAVFLHACSILDIMSLHDEALQHIPLLRRVIERHHVAFNQVYGPEDAIPKLHYVMHLPDCLTRQGANFSAFVVERKHRLVKSIAVNVFNNFEQTLVEE